jgi:predicted alpha/beta superfamily hydrolase
MKEKLIPDILIVGIAYDTDNDSYYSLRCRDLTPSKSIEYDCNGSGGAENFKKFIKSELFPFSESNYYVDSTEKSLFGYSFGGLFGSYTLFRTPGMFNRYLLLSPSLWWNKKEVFTYIPDKIETTTYLYVTTGELENVKEHFGESMVDHHKQLEAILKSKNYGNLIMKFEIQENETHRTIFGTGLTKGLRFIYSDFKLKK